MDVTFSGEMVMTFSTFLWFGASLPKMRMSSSWVTAPYFMRVVYPSGCRRLTSPVAPWATGRFVPSRVVSMAEYGYPPALGIRRSTALLSDQ